ncbi:MAG: transposase, partial [Nitrosopumilaceae archaeon]
MFAEQSLHDHFNEYAPVFLKAALEKLLQKQVLKHVHLGKLSHFKRVLIKDSVRFEVYLGSEKDIKVRLVICLLPDQEVEKRLRKAAKNNKKKARKPLSKEYKARAALNLFITDTTPEQIATDSIWPVYRLRWQIELIFKVWKSICKIHEVKKVKQHRLECYV